ncbi:MurR/RpiR family transcriptional regulator [Clostridium isatidis]|uniref:RpiR family transcriptional regulator n=1 Tax=Clostridium isatidis TaxID=182773 RepID=A0A343JFP5_9CLOT|nr:MurR/RpiR family transcriptional regulator [Clostridium isatidis]ASW44353.1 RpiR family transcriptional regulator [Clostridium isatidis]
MDILCEIQNKYTQFSEKEKAIADYILQYGDKIKNINITDLAKEIGTSGATITRFSKKIGCDNFVDMKIKLSSTGSESAQNEEEGIFSYVYKYYNEVIEKTKLIIDKDSIFKVVNEIKKAKHIYIYGVGSSGLTGEEMMQRLLRMGFNVHSITDSHMMIINSSIVSMGDLIIGISISGETEELIQALRLSKKRGAKIVGMTSFKDSMVSKLSDIELIVYNPKFVDKNKFINSQFSVMYIIDLISMVLLEDHKLNEKMQITIDAILKNN